MSIATAALKAQREQLRDELKQLRSKKAVADANVSNLVAQIASKQGEIQVMTDAIQALGGGN